MNLTDLASEEKWRELQNELHENFHLNADIMDKEGRRLLGNTWGNTLCKTIREDAKGFSSICVTAGQMFTHLIQQGEPFVEECDGGMMRVSVPVMKDDELIGAVGGCGLVAEDGEVEEFTIGMMSDITEEKIAELAQGAPIVSEERVKEIQAFIDKRIAEIIG